jgi:hypothetical protein
METVESIMQIGPYELGPVLGSGAFAIVRAATHVPTNEKVLFFFSYMRINTYATHHNVIPLSLP